MVSFTWFWEWLKGCAVSPEPSFLYVLAIAPQKENPGGASTTEGSGLTGWRLLAEKLDAEKLRRIHSQGLLDLTRVPRLL